MSSPQDVANKVWEEFDRESRPLSREDYIKACEELECQLQVAREAVCYELEDE